MRRHKRHLKEPERTSGQDALLERMVRALGHAEALFDSCQRLADHRGCDQALSKIVSLTEAIQRMRAAQASGFESMSTPEQIKFLYSYKDGLLAREMIDSVLREHREFLKLGERGEQAESDSQLN